MKYLVNILYLDSHLEPDSEETKIVDLLELHRLLDDCDCVIEYIIPYEMSLLDPHRVQRNSRATLCRRAQSQFHKPCGLLTFQPPFL